MRQSPRNFGSGGWLSEADLRTEDALRLVTDPYWSPVPDGAIPELAPGTPGLFFRESNANPAVSDVHLPADAKSDKLSSVVSTSTGKWHLYRQGAIRTTCRNFACGSETDPHPDASFFEGTDPRGYTSCGSCQPKLETGLSMGCLSLRLSLDGVCP